MEEYRIVCIDDDEQFLLSLERSLPDRVEVLCPDFRCTFEFAASVEELSEVLSHLPKDGSLAMAISDQMIPGVRGIDLIEKLKADYGDIVTMLLTGHGSLDSAKYAINRGLLDQYIAKPIEDIHVFVSLVANLLKRHHLDLMEKKRTEQLAKTVEQLQHSNEEISEMQSAAETIAMLSKCFKSLDLDEVISVISRELPKVFGAEQGVMCFDPKGCPAELAQQGSPTCPTHQATSQITPSTSNEANETSTDVPAAVCSELGGKQPPEIIVPFSIRNYGNSDDVSQERPGYLCMYGVTPSKRCSENMMKYKASLASEFLSACLTNAKLYQQAKRDSEVDYLTGASTRRILEDKLQAEYERAVRYNHSFCVMMVDVDRFKKINDSAGHIAGDQALNQLTDVLSQEARQTDTLARYGGDEFAILMPETDLESAVRAAERMRQKANAIVTPQDQAMTISCGVAEWSGSESESGTDVLRRADSALREAKNIGRNNVQVGKAA